MSSLLHCGDFVTLTYNRQDSRAIGLPLLTLRQSIVETSLRARQQAAEGIEQWAAVGLAPGRDFFLRGQHCPGDLQDAAASQAPTDIDSDPEQTRSVGVPSPQDEGMGGAGGDGTGVQIPLSSDPPTEEGDDPMDGQVETATGANGQAPAQDEQDQQSEADSEGDLDDGPSAEGMLQSGRQGRKVNGPSGILSIGQWKCGIT
uniref:Uncharacterized protein n=1 Tax=Chromera velia CCMP2878 TaxID=1169474 RepID=A0A0G4ID38_9ALVE|eukprot:Cvel_13227.t1-p1 / transcript=Cvel_13227.t1 / gene=Cvel_13227 / organism=Chromera_velia_CCMP2878 / gene_product=hypothetical protein / transcript_product=hypothetical protein / location=Cvel_scaffold896:1670-4745(-) / protein_length=201 / sequence_SO=supercontig / SO=protein_coding / is_pseudo=false